MKSKIGQRNTKQREVIQQCLQEAPGPLSVEAIHLEAQKELDHLGTATVYRTVALLLEQEVIRKVILADGHVRYEPIERKSHHHHFVCRVCEQSYCFDACPVSATPPSSLPGNFTVERHELTLHGVCEACQ